MHQKSFVEDIAIEVAGFGILHHDLRGLRQPCQQLVRGVRGVDHGVVAARTVGPDGVHVLVELMKRGMRQPGFIKVQGVDLRAELLFDHLDVVDDAVICALRDRQNARTLVDGLAGKRIGLDLFADVFGVEFLEGNRPDDAQVIARGPQKHRDCTCHGDGMQD